MNVGRGKTERVRERTVLHESKGKAIEPQAYSYFSIIIVFQVNYKQRTKIYLKLKEENDIDLHNAYAIPICKDLKCM